MIKAVSLRNFQSWKRLDLELGQITVIVGEGEIGKSAIVRAIKYALTNKGGDGFIRNGQEEAVVGIAFDDSTLAWRKARGRGGEYNLDGREFTKTGTTVPPAIIEATGVRGVEIDKTTRVYPQIHTQWDPPFLVKESGTQRARILGKLTKLDVLVQAQILARRDYDQWTKDITAISKERIRITEKMANLPDLERARFLRGKLIEAQEKLDEYQKQQRALEQHFSALTVYQKAQERLAAAEEAAAQAEAAYNQVLEEQGICEHCPVRGI